MIKFNKEEISLCKQVREKELLLKPVKEGDWIRNEYGKESTDLVTSEYIRNILRFIDIKHWFPLWTISDCLEFLRENKWNDIVVEIKPYSDIILCFAERGEVDKGYEREVVGEGNTPLEACLKAVIEVLKNEEI